MIDAVIGRLDCRLDRKLCYGATNSTPDPWSPIMNLCAQEILTSSINTHNNALVSVHIAINISRPIKLLPRSLDPVLAKVLRLVVAGDLHSRPNRQHHRRTHRQRGGEEKHTAHSHPPFTQWKSWKRRRASAMMASLGVTSTPSQRTLMLRQEDSHASSDVHYR